MISSAYLRLLIFSPEILIPTCDSSSPAFHKMDSAKKLNKQGDNIQPFHTPFLILNQSIVSCLVLTVASWPAYRFLSKQVRWYGIPISLRMSHILLWSTHSKALAVKKAEVDVFLEFPCFLYDPTDIIFCMIQQNLISVPLPFLNPAWTSGHSQFTYCWRLAWIILNITLLVSEMSAIVW